MQPQDIPFIVFYVDGVNRLFSATRVPTDFAFFVQMNAHKCPILQTKKKRLARNKDVFQPFGRCGTNFEVEQTKP